MNHLMFYVCAISTGHWIDFLAGPYDAEDEAIAASGAYEVEHPEYRMRTFVWTCREGREYLSRRYDPIAGSSRAESADPLFSQLPSPHLAAANHLPSADSCSQS
jgi:hypothetical protein